MPLRGLRSRLSAVAILAPRFANPLTQRGITFVVRSRVRAARGCARFGFCWPATRIRHVATLSPARRAISENARGCLIASVYARSHSDVTFSEIAVLTLPAGRSRHSKRVRIREEFLPLEPLEHGRSPNRAIVCAFAVARAVLRAAVVTVFTGPSRHSMRV